jgi:transposase InsO family protein
VVCDYFSNYIDVERLQITTTKAIVKALMTFYARYGVPDTLVTDNGPQFSSAEFATFRKVWGFEHTTSSPHYPQPNGKAENAVRTVKRLEKYPNRGCWNKPSTMVLRSPVQDPPTIDPVTAATPLPHS